MYANLQMYYYLVAILYKTFIRETCSLRQNLYSKRLTWANSRIYTRVFETEEISLLVFEEI